ncbi:MAG: DsrE family protein [Clostridiales bacterium]|nr:DsrE family protein [Clostridiales bacterium]
MNESKKLHILWITDNPDTAHRMVLLYAANSMLYRLWDSVTVILWGAPVRLITENETLQEQLQIARHAGVHFSACISCAGQYGVVEKLETLGIEVKPWTEPLTEIIQGGKPFLSV